MKHSLKFDAFVLLIGALTFGAIELTSSSESSGFLLPLVVVTMLVGLGFLEIDRRLCLLEKDKVEKDQPVE